MVNFHTRISDCDSHSPALLDLYLSSDPRICSTMTFSPLGILMWLSQFPMTFHQTQYIMIHFITKLMTILELIGMVVIIWEMLCWRISLNSMLVLLLVNFASGFRLELMYISLIVNIKSNLTHLHGFQLLVLLL